MMTPNYPKLIAETIQVLPVGEQAEVYSFAQYVRTKASGRRLLKRSARRRKSVFNLFGTAVAKVTDGAVNHDKYLYE